MTILEKTPTRLVVQSGPHAGRFLVAVFMLVIIVIMLVSTQSPTFACQRNDDGSGQCTLTEYRLIDTTAQSFQLTDISNAQVSTEPGEYRGRPKTYYKLTVQVGDSVVPVATNDRPEQYQTARQINAFLSDPTQRRLEIKPNANASFPLVELVAAATALWLGGSALLITIFIFDRSTGQLSIRDKWLRSRTTTYSLSDVDHLQVKVIPASRQQRESRIIHIILKSGRMLPDSLPHSEGLMRTIRLYLNPAAPSHAQPEQLAVKTPNQATPRPIHRVKYRRAKQPKHDSSTNT